MLVRYLSAAKVNCPKCRQRLVLVLSLVALSACLLGCGGMKPRSDKPQGPSLETQPEPVTTPTKDAKAEDKKPDASTLPVDLSKQMVVLDPIRIHLVRTHVGKVPLKTIGGTGESKDDLFQVTLRIENTHQTRKLDYHGWSTEGPWLSDSGTLADEHGNHYKRITFGFGNKVAGQVYSESIYPGESITDVLVFERPVDAAKRLTLTLPASNFGGKGKVRVLVPRAFSRQRLEAKQEEERQRLEAKQEEERQRLVAEKERERQRLEEEQRA
jgi:hypothetical protein